MHSVAISPGLHALVTAATDGSTGGGSGSAGGHSSGLPPHPPHMQLAPNMQQQQQNAQAHASAKPITGMSILQLASPRLHANSMPPPPSPLLAAASASAAAASMAPPAAPAHLSHLSLHMAAALHAQQQHAHAAAQAQLLSLVVEGKERGPEEDDEDAAAAIEHMEREDEYEDEEEEEDEDEQPHTGNDGADSPSSQSCPPSPLASLAMLSADAAASHSSPYDRKSLSHASQRRRASVGSHVHQQQQHQPGLSDRRNSMSSSERSSERHSTSVFKRPKVSVTAGSPAFKKKQDATSSGSGEGGSSCHQCKSRRNFSDLTYCTSSLHKKNKSAVCRKKFCSHCLKKFYRELPHPSSATSLWKCPSCRKICSCAACRRREQRDEDGAPSTDVTPMPTPLYRGENPRDADMMASSPLTGSSPSPSALSMQRLMLSPTGPSMMSPLPPSSAMAQKLILANSSLLSSTARVAKMSSMMHSSPPLHSAPSTTFSTPHSISPPPMERDAMGGTVQATSPATHTSSFSAAAASTFASSAKASNLTPSNIASLTALSQAAMRDSPPHSITVSLQNHTGAHPNGTSTASLSSGSTASSPTELRQTVGPGSATKSTSTLYSNLLLNGSSPHSSSTPTLTPRSLTRAMHNAQSNGLAGALASAAGSTSPHNLRSASTVQAAALAAAAAAYENGSHTSTEAAGGEEGQMEEAAAQQHTTPFMGVLPSFALFYSLGQLPSIQQQVTDILRSSELTSNRERLRLVEELFFTAAEKVHSEEWELRI